MVGTILPFISVFLSIAIIPLFKKQANWIALTTVIIQIITMAYWQNIGIETSNLIYLNAYENIIYYFVHLEPTSMILMQLTLIITGLCIVYSWKMPSAFFVLFMILDIVLMLFFSTNNLLLFYILFELSLVPIFLVIGIWGSETRISAAFKFIFYTLTGSILFIVSIILISVLTKQSLDFETLKNSLSLISEKYRIFIWIAMFIAFAVKIPMFPFHTWLPAAHVQAPASGSMILAGILIKMGIYGMLRILLPLMPAISMKFADTVIILSIIAIIYTSFVAYAQTDMKKMIAYSSIAHMGIATSGIFSMTQAGIEGAIFQMVSHGIVSSALFLCIGMLYERQHTRAISNFSGLAKQVPFFSCAFIILSMASIGLPGTSGFIGEFLSILGVFQKSPIKSFLCATGVIFSACYMLKLCKSIIWGDINTDKPSITKENIKEKICLSVLVLLTLLLGIKPNYILSEIHKTSDHIINFINIQSI